MPRPNAAERRKSTKARRNPEDRRKGGERLISEKKLFHRVKVSYVPPEGGSPRLERRGFNTPMEMANFTEDPFLMPQSLVLKGKFRETTSKKNGSRDGIIFYPDRRQGEERRRGKKK